MLRHTRWRLNPYDEIAVVGSRWRRIYATPRGVAGGGEDVGPPHVKAHLARPFITLLPTLHVGSMKFYDAVLEYMRAAVRERTNVVVLLEGICDSAEAELSQLEEYTDIFHNESLRQTMLEKADTNTLYDEATTREICKELSLNFDALREEEGRVRLQECYLKPKMAAYVGHALRNDADLNMEEVVQLLREEAEAAAMGGEAAAVLEAARIDGAMEGGSLSDRVGGSEIPLSLADIGRHPRIRRFREEKVARAARKRCADWLSREITGEVIVPWGFYHIDPIHRVLMSLNAAAAADDGVILVESSRAVRILPFGLPKHLLTSLDVEVELEKAAGEWSRLPVTPPPPHGDLGGATVASPSEPARKRSREE